MRQVLFLPRYDSRGASSRLRFLQYIPFFKKNKLSIDVSYLLSNSYLDRLYSGHSTKADIVKAYLSRLLVLFRLYRYDLIVLEKELFPFLPPFFEKLLNILGKPYLVDFDDAWFHRYDKHRSPIVRAMLGKKIDRVMKYATVVTVGNDYLAKRALTAGAKKVVKIPTVVDLRNYFPSKSQKLSGEQIVIGWIGTPKTSHYLQSLVPVFKELKDRLGVKIVAVGANQRDFDQSLVETLPWTEQTEVGLIQQFDIGIMPLEDTDWERGKCGYKLIQYMACGVPVVGTPVGMNLEIVKHGINGLLATSSDEWLSTLELLCDSVEKRSEMGKAGRELVENWYSLEIQQKRFLSTITEAMKS